jgi:hypothetical protein
MNGHAVGDHITNPALGAAVEATPPSGAVGLLPRVDALAHVIADCCALVPGDRASSAHLVAPYGRRSPWNLGQPQPPSLQGPAGPRWNGALWRQNRQKSAYEARCDGLARTTLVPGGSPWLAELANVPRAPLPAAVSAHRAGTEPLGGGGVAGAPAGGLPLCCNVARGHCSASCDGSTGCLEHPPSNVHATGFFGAGTTRAGGCRVSVFARTPTPTRGGSVP